MEPVRAVPPPAGTRRVWGVCPHDCPDTCAMVVDVEDAPDGPKAVRIGGDPQHPVTRGALCVKVNNYLKRTYSPERLQYPMRRVGPKGEGRFERITWDEAIAEVATGLRRAIDTHGPESILPYSYAGTMGILQFGSVDRRLFHTLGASHLERTICSTAGEFGTKLVLGNTVGTEPEAFEHADLILLWGTNTITSNVHLWPFVRAAQKRGARVITIDPVRTRTAEKSDEHVAPLPGTDAALAFGIMHVCFRDGLADEDYLTAHTEGWEALRDRVRDYPPERVDTICGIPPGTTERLGRLWGETERSIVRVNYGMQRHAGGGSAIRACACLPAVNGSYQRWAGGYLLSSSGAFNVAVDKEPMVRSDLAPPDTRTINMSRLGEALLDIDDPPVAALVVYNSNPGAMAPDQNRVTRGLQREDLFTVVLEHFQTDTTDYADIVLPATTQLEHDDLHTAYGHYYLGYNKASIPPVGESLPNTEIFRRIAKAMGLDDPMFDEGDDSLLASILATGHPHLDGIDLDRVKREHWVRLNLPERFVPYAHGSPYTDSGKILIVNEEARAWGMDPVPDYIPPAETPDGEGRTSDYTFGQPTEAEPDRAYPLRFLSPPAHHFLNTSFVNVLKDQERGAPWVEIHPDDAAPRRIATGDLVVVENQRGAQRLVAEVTDRARPGTLVAPSIWWRRMTEDGFNANALTGERITDIGHGATFYDCVAEARKAD